MPEVQTIVSDLNEHIRKWNINKVCIANGYKKIPDIEGFRKNTEGKTILAVERVGKNILIKLSSGNFIRIHLAMTGRILLRNLNTPEDRWTKVVFSLSKENVKKELKFTDPRMFGKTEVVDSPGVDLLRKKYGPEPVGKVIKPEEFLKLIKSKKTNLKNFLLDQKKISGLGNIYATEALFLAKINPQTHTSKLGLKEAKNLLAAAEKVLSEGIANRGSTLIDRSYVDIFGKEGSHQNHFKIYMKKVCPRCSSKVSFIKLNGRGTYFCPNCQPLK